MYLTLVLSPYSSVYYLEAIKLAFNLNSLSPAILKNKCVMNYEMTVEYFSCYNIYRTMKTESHLFFKNRISSLQIEHEYRTRATSLELIDLPLYRRTKCQKSFLYKGLSFWNKLPLDIRNIPNDLRQFKRSLRMHILNRT